MKTLVGKLYKVYSNKNQAQQVLYWLLEKLLDKTQAQLITQNDLQLTSGQQEQLDEWIRQIVDEHKPLQYILGSVPFLDLDILVQPPILIPRPETEWWVNELIQKFSYLKNEPLKILDLCSGSGCIALTLAKYFVNSKVVAIDISKEACALIKKNITHNRVNNVTVIESDLFESFDSLRSFRMNGRKSEKENEKFAHPELVEGHERAKYDLIVSNPPYIPAENYQNLDLSVRMWEDRVALVAPDSDLSIIKRIIESAPKYLQKKHSDLPQLWLEIDETQGSDVCKLMQNSFEQVDVVVDQFGSERVVVGRKKINLSD